MVYIGQLEHGEAATGPPAHVRDTAYDLRPPPGLGANRVDSAAVRGAPWALLCTSSSVVSGRARRRGGGRDGLLSGHGRPSPPFPLLTGQSGHAPLTGPP